MDDYPDELAPEFEESGAVKTPFDEWWPRVKSRFPHVPEDVARYWLHEHWKHSPYAYLRSSEWRFELQDWPCEKLFEVVSTWANFDPSNAACLEKGRELVEHEFLPGYRYRTASYMLENRDFPQPIIVLDNRQGHVTKETVDADWKALPQGFVLIEGHRRFNIALYLQKTARLDPTIKVWVMRHVSET